MGELKLTTESSASKIDVVDWVARSMIGIAYLLIGFTKLEPHSSWEKLFADIGFGQWFRYLTGVIQLVGAVMFLAPRTARIGGGMLACTMVGAALVHLFVLDTGVTAAILPGFAAIAILVITLRS